MSPFFILFLRRLLMLLEYLIYELLIRVPSSSPTPKTQLQNVVKCPRKLASFLNFPFLRNGFWLVQLPLCRELAANQCDQIWQNIAIFGNIFKVFGNYVRAYFVLGKNMNLLWSTFMPLAKFSLLHVA